ncbi:methyltransferase domain-containing protein [Synechococcus sp. 1G10]|uniref:class I SAM-dependent methyltransferase n=1 Tax=Synechococcus sp. 1G10 TaxID=2025605 RepID=UPI001303653A|nr:methyltransferase domain-containing protein [Synechococcus sp. 1G10]
MKQHVFDDAFDQRAAVYSVKRIRQYNQAMRSFPETRATERRLILDLLNAQQGQDVCDVAAGGGYLADGILDQLGSECNIYCIENSSHFSDSIPAHYHRIYCSLSRLALPTSSMDRMACLAGLHHQEDKQQFFREAFRALRPNGLIAVGDVLHGSAPAQFLNVEVNRWSDLGHEGIFLEPGELSLLLSNAGFVDIVEQEHHYTWDLPSHADLVWFCKTLFRMEKAELSDVEAALPRYFTIQLEQGIARMPWSLIYARGRKPQ